MDERTTPDVIVVGGGLAGLSAAAHLSRGGASVRVLESRTEVGGRARTDEVRGACLNLGPHALYRGGVGAEVLDGLGIDPPGWDVPLAGARGHVEGTTAPLPLGLGGLVRTRLLTRRGKWEIAAFLAGLRRTDPDSVAGVTVERWLSDRFTDASARRLADALVRLATYADLPAVMSADAAVDQLRRSERGVRYLDHGWGSLVRTLADRATAAGATITPAAPVRSVARRPDGVTVTTDAGPVAAAAVVLAVPPAVADRLLGDTDLVAEAGPPAVASILDLVLRDLPTHRFALGLTSPHYASRHAPDARLVPDGRVLVSAATYGDPGGVEPRLRRGELRTFVHESGLADREVLDERYLHRVVVTHGSPTAERGGRAGRPSGRIDERTWVAGDWVGPVGLRADASLASGRAAATGLAPVVRGRHVGVGLGG